MIAANLFLICNRADARTRAKRTQKRVKLRPVRMFRSEWMRKLIS